MPKKNDPRTALGRELRELREGLRYSQDEWGEKLSVSGTVISRWETGQYKPPIESLARLADLASENEQERDTLYSHWISLAGHRSIKSDTRSAASVTTEHIPVTLEGAMGRAIIDRIPDPEQRLRLVLHLRDLAQTLPEGGEESAPALDLLPEPLALQAPPDDPE